MEYRVIWEIEVDADSPEQAAREAKTTQLDHRSMANCFDVIDDDGIVTQVDLDKINGKI